MQNLRGFPRGVHFTFESRGAGQSGSELVFRDFKLVFRVFKLLDGQLLPGLSELNRP